MRKTYLIILLLCIAPCTLYSQASNPGYLGKRFIVKLNIVNGIRPLYLGGEVEYTVSRRFILGAGGGYLTSTYNQTYYEEYDGGYQTYWAKKVTKGGCNVNSFSFYGQMKYFPASGIFPAPVGFYIGAKIGGGSADIESSTGKPIKVAMGYTPPTSWSVKGIPFAFLEGGVGYQKIYLKRLVLDAGAYLNFTTLNPTGTSETQTYTATVASDFGPNTLWMFQTPDNGKPDLAGAKKQVVFNSNFGLSIYFKIGILIF